VPGGCEERCIARRWRAYDSAVVLSLPQGGSGGDLKHKTCLVVSEWLRADLPAIGTQVELKSRRIERDRGEECISKRIKRRHPLFA
jgi:hypothetical protein